MAILLVHQVRSAERDTQNDSLLIKCILFSLRSFLANSVRQCETVSQCDWRQEKTKKLFEMRIDPSEKKHSPVHCSTTGSVSCTDALLKHKARWVVHWQCKFRPLFAYSSIDHHSLGSLGPQNCSNVLTGVSVLCPLLTTCLSSISTTVSFDLWALSYCHHLRRQDYRANLTGTRQFIFVSTLPPLSPTWRTKLPLRHPARASLLTHFRVSWCSAHLVLLLIAGVQASVDSFRSPISSTTIIISPIYSVTIFWTDWTFNFTSIIFTMAGTILENLSNRKLFGVLGIICLIQITSFIIGAFISKLWWWLTL